MSLNISNLNVKQHKEHTEISAKLDFQTLWYRLPNQFTPDAQDATPFLMAMLIPAMFLGEDITVEDSLYVSEKTLSNLDKIQEIYVNWNKSFSKIQIHANAKRLEKSSNKVGSFFSGGVDGSYTMLKHIDEIDYLILINGFDFGMGNKTWRNMVERNKNYVEHYNKTLLAIETNFKTFILNYGLARVTNYGFQLASIASLLGLEKTYFSASATYAHIEPSGSHPLTDHLLDTENCRFVHTGLEADRFEKLSLLKKDSFAISQLWVCWKNPKENCGECSKCIRTYLALKLNDATDAIKFLNNIDLKKLKQINIMNDNDYIFFSNFLKVAEQKQFKDIAKLLRMKFFKYKVKQFILDIDRYLLNNKIASIKNNKHDLSNLEVKVGLSYRYSDNYMRKKVKSLTSMEDIAENNSVVGSIYFHDESLDNDTKGEVPSS